MNANFFLYYYYFFLKTDWTTITTYRGKWFLTRGVFINFYAQHKHDSHNKFIDVLRSKPTGSSRGIDFAWLKLTKVKGSNDTRVFRPLWLHFWSYIVVNNNRVLGVHCTNKCGTDTMWYINQRHRHGEGDMGNRQPHSHEKCLYVNIGYYKNIWFTNIIVFRDLVFHLNTLRFFFFSVNIGRMLSQ